MKVHTFGDSHSTMGFNNTWSDPHIQIHYLGPKLCHSVGRDGLNLLNIKNYNVENGDIVIFCFGSIDCNSHVNKYVNETTSYEHVIDLIIEKYFPVLQKNIEFYDEIYPCVYNVVPPAHKYEVTGNDAFPFRGTDDERKQYLIYFNKKLKQMCKEYNYFFFDIYDMYTNTDGFLDTKYSDGHIHIQNGIYLQQFLDKLKKEIKWKKISNKIVDENISNWRQLDNSIIDNTKIDEGHVYFHKMLNNGININTIVYVASQNDKYGSPILHNFGDIKLSSTSLKYTYQAYKICEFLKSMNYNKINIIHKDAEYLGLVVILFFLIKEMNIKINKYYICDYDHMIKLQKYCNQQYNLNIEFEKYENIGNILNNNIVPTFLISDNLINNSFYS